MPANNAGRFIGLAVRSVLTQSWRQLELIVVDDASTDDTAARVEGFRDDRVHLVRLDRNVGVSDARNAGIRIAQAPLLAFLDADDESEPERLAMQLAFLASRDDVDVLGSAISCIDESGRQLGYRSYPMAHEEIVHRMMIANPFALSAVVARKDAVMAEGGFDPVRAPAEDYDLWSRMAVSGARFANMSEPLTRYRLHAGASKAVSLKPQLRVTIDIKNRYWRTQMGPAARVRLVVEHALLYAPSTVVMRAFVALSYRRRLGR